MSDPQTEPASTEPQAPMTDAEVAASTIPPDPVGAPSTITDTPATTDPDAHPAMGSLDRIEALAIRFGGDVMTEIRHLVAEVRSLL